MSGLQKHARRARILNKTSFEVTLIVHFERSEKTYVIGPGKIERIESIIDNVDWTEEDRMPRITAYNGPPDPNSVLTIKDFENILRGRSLSLELDVHPEGGYQVSIVDCLPDQLPQIQATQIKRYASILP